MEISSVAIEKARVEPKLTYDSRTYNRGSANSYQLFTDRLGQYASSRETRAVSSSTVAMNITSTHINDQSTTEGWPG